MNLDERARRATTALHGHADAIDDRAILEAITGRPPRARWTVPATAATVAAAVTAGAIALPRVVEGPRIDDPGEVAAGGERSTGWQRVPADRLGGMADDGELEEPTAAAVVGDTIVVAGRDGDVGALWRSRDDGATWERLPDVASGLVDARDPAFLHDLTVHAGRFVGVGSAGPGAHHTRPAAVHADVDGSFTRGGVPEDAGVELLGVASDGERLVAVGAQTDADGTSRPAVYTSTDAISWERVAELPATDGTSARLLEVAASDRGFLAVGRGAPAGADSTTFVWASPDGVVWTPVAAPDGPVQDVHAVADGWLLAGSDGGVSGGDAVVWTGAPDAGWALHRLEESGVGSGAEDLAVLPDGRLLVAGWAAGDAAVWLGDGSDWQRDPTVGEVGTATIAAATGGGAVVVGTASSDTDIDGMVWSLGGPPLAGDPSDPPSDPPSGDPDAATEASFGPLPVVDLPPPIDAMRRRIDGAAAAGSYEELEAIALEGIGDFTYSFGGPGEGPAAYWRRQAAGGDDPLTVARTLLRLPHARVVSEPTPESPATSYIWPSVAGDAPTEADWQALRDSGLYPEDAIDRFREIGYLGWRIVIDANGDWTAFVAGD